MIDIDDNISEGVFTESPDDQIETSMEGPKRVGLFIFFLVFIVFGGWAAFAPLGGAAQAPGRVTVESYSKVVQHLEGGIVGAVLVRNGDMVSEGQPLLMIENTQSLAQLEIANSQFVALKVREARLLAERDDLDAVVYPEILDRNDSRVREEMGAQNEIFQARKAANEGSEEVLEQRISQLESKVVGLTALKASKEQLAASYAEEVVDTQALLEQGFSDRTRLRELARNHANFQGEAADLTASIASTEVQIGETRLQILQQKREFQNEVVSELGDAQTNLNDVAERINAMRDVVARTVVRAPSDGIVNGMQFHTVGGVISPGSKIVDIVPQGEELIVEAKVATIDIDRVALGQQATIRFSTFGSSVPTIFGNVINLSADSFTDEYTGIPYYLARIEVTPEGMADLGNLVLMPGMPAEVYISTGNRTFLQYLFKPFSNALARSFNED
ncbi:MAG: HlyD family type I secretion periplasmic adaptor subunit [Proteobacteria bacterium]|nr:HlyD family type I secretion periplasmic adaptor subunit [Pseudomonadota bacterium]